MRGLTMLLGAHLIPEGKPLRYANLDLDAMVGL